VSLSAITTNLLANRNLCGILSAFSGRFGETQSRQESILVGERPKGRPAALNSTTAQVLYMVLLLYRRRPR